MTSVTAARRALLASAGVIALGVPGAALAQSVATPSEPTAAQLLEALKADHARIQELEAEVQGLSGEVRALRQQQTADHAVVTARATAAPAPAPQTQVQAQAANVSIAGGRPTIASADGRFSASLHGILQFDLAAYDQTAPGPITTDFRRSGPALGATASNVDFAHARDLKNGDVFRRARIGVDGVAFGDWDYRLIFDFAGTATEDAGQLYEGWVQYSGLKPFEFRVGAFSPSLGLEDQGSTSTMPFLERPASIDVARNLAAGDTRTAGEIYYAANGWLASAAVTGRTIGVLNTGTASPTPQTFGDQLGFVARVAGVPVHGDDWLVHVGVHGSYVAQPANTSGPSNSGVNPASPEVIAFSNTPELRVDGTKLINTGNIDAHHADEEGAELAFQKQQFFVQGEYESLGVSRTNPGVSSPRFSGWYVEGTWILTGERRRYNPVTAAFDGPPVDHPFSLAKGGWGAWEVGARYSELDLNYHAGASGTAPSVDAIRGGDQQIWTAGLNWYPNTFVRFMLDYQHVRIDRLSPNASVYQTPTGAQIGQAYDAIALRSQFAF
jgi:phosphate-selective porin OprO/OprP